MINADAIENFATLHTERLRLEPLGPEHFDTAWAALHDPEGKKLTGTHATFTQDQIRTWLAGLAAKDDRIDWAIIRLEDGVHIGEVVLNDLDDDNESISFRIALAGPEVFGKGYGTEATKAALDYAFDVVGLHRVFLEVYAFNPRARRSYEKCGFVFEGTQRDALLWEGEWVDAHIMGILATDPRP